MTEAGTRIYLGNLPSEVTEKEIKKRLKSFGRAAEVDIKHRTDHEGKITATFAHLTVSMEKGNIDQCLEYLNEQQWNGYTAKAEVAKESYLKRMEAKRANSFGNTRVGNHAPVEPNPSKHQEDSVTSKLIRFDKTPINSKNEKTPASTKSPKYVKPNGKDKVFNSESKKRKSRHDSDSSESEAEVFWQKGIHKENTVTIDTEASHQRHVTPQGQKQRNSLLSKLESFSSIWDDPTPAPFRDSYTYSTPSRIREESPNKIYQNDTEENSFNGQKNETTESNKYIKNIYNEKKSEVSEEKKTPVDKKRSIEKYSGSKSKSVVNEIEHHKLSSGPPSVDKYKSSNGKSKINPKINLKKLQGDEKRRKSLNERMDAIQQQQETVRRALAGEPVNKKIRFVEEEKEEQTGESVVTNGRAPATLFDAESDEEEQQNDFAIRQQFEGRKGEKLLELQARFATDDRFRLDQRFAESDSEEGEPAEEGEESNEQQKQLTIINSILGPNQTPTARPAKQQEKGMKAIVRFDPSKPEHGQKYTVSAEQPSKKKKKKHGEDEDGEVAETNETPMPAVSSERFYQVSDTLQQALVPAGSQDKKFTLRSLFGGQQEDNESEKEDDETPVEQAVTVQEPSRQKRKVKNPMDFEAEEVTTEVPTQPATAIGATWSETFFFKQDDPRLQEGLEFFRAAKREGKEEFEQRRHELWVSVKAKLRNVARKKVTFERKLGGRSTKPGRGGKPGGRGGNQRMSRGNNGRRR